MRIHRTRELFEGTGSPTAAGRHGRSLLRGAVATAAVVALFAGVSGVASAAPDSDGHTTIANVGVNNAIALTGLTGTFELDGTPGSTVTDGALASVSFSVVTNNQAGYNVSVVPEAETLLPVNPLTNPDSIPVGNLQVSSDAKVSFAGLVAGTPTVVRNQLVRSLSDGDPYQNFYRVIVPFVNTDIYSVNLDYVATAN